MSSTIFTGVSRYSNDFSAVIDRAVSIASLPLKQMQQNQVRLQAEGTALSLLETRVTALRTTLDRLTGSASTRATVANSSDPSAVQPTASEQAADGEYSVKVTSLGSYSSLVATEFASVADPAAGLFTSGEAITIKIGDDSTVTLTPANQTLNALVDEINSKVGSKVRAVVVNVSSTSTPSYTLSLQSKSYGDIALTLQDGTTTPVIATTNLASEKGSLVTYEVNGAQLQSQTRSVALAPGLTLDLKEVTGTAVTVSTQRTTAAFETAIEEFISAYNGVMTEMGKHRGESGGALSGNSILHSVTQSLRRAINFEGVGTLSTLALAGVEFTREGNLKLNRSLLNAQTGNGLEPLAELLGDGTTDGFLKAMKAAIDGLLDSESGFLSGTATTNKERLASQSKRIQEEQARVDRLQTDLEKRMVDADATIAMLEQQATYFTNMFEAMRANQKSYS